MACSHPAGGHFNHAGLDVGRCERDSAFEGCATDRACVVELYHPTCDSIGAKTHDKNRTGVVGDAIDIRAATVGVCRDPDAQHNTSGQRFGCRNHQIRQHRDSAHVARRVHEHRLNFGVSAKTQAALRANGQHHMTSGPITRGHNSAGQLGRVVVQLDTVADLGVAWQVNPEAGRACGAGRVGVKYRRVGRSRHRVCVSQQARHTGHAHPGMVTREVQRGDPEESPLGIERNGTQPIDTRSQVHTGGDEQARRVGVDGRGIQALIRLVGAVVVQIVEKPDIGIRRQTPTDGHRAKFVGEAVIGVGGIVGHRIHPQSVLIGTYGFDSRGRKLDRSCTRRRTHVASRIHGSGREVVQAIAEGRANMCPAPGGGRTDHGC